MPPFPAARTQCRPVRSSKTGPETATVARLEDAGAPYAEELSYTVRALDLVRYFLDEFGAGVYSLKSLFRDNQQRIVREVLKTTLAEAEAVLRQIYEHNATLMRFLSGLRTPMPRVFGLTAEFVLNNNLRRAVAVGNGNVDRKRIAQGVEQSLMLATALAPKIGYDAAAALYHGVPEGKADDDPVVVTFHPLALRQIVGHCRGRLDSEVGGALLGFVLRRGAR